MKNVALKKIIVIVGVVLLCAAMLIAYFFGVVPTGRKGVKTVTLEIVYSDKTFTYKDLTTEKETVLQLLEEYDEKYDLGLKYEDSAYGAFLTEMKNTANDAESGNYYTFKINSEYSNFGVSTATIADKDVITLEYGSTTYDPDTYKIIGFTPAPCADATAKGQTATHRSAGQVAVIACCSVVAAAAVAAVLFVLISKDTSKDDADSQEDGAKSEE